MINLLRTDFYRLIKNKLVLISLIVAAAFPFVIAAAFCGLKALVSLDGEEMGDIIDAVLDSHMLVASTFSFTNNFGIALPIFATILVMADINSGTIRNKIILGYSRHKIFLSHFITSLAYCLVLITVYAGMTALWSVVFLKTGDISAERVRSLIYFYILGLLLYAMVAAIATSLSLVTFSSVGSIILTIVLCMSIGLATQLVAAFDYSKFENIVNFVPAFVVGVFQMSEINTTMFLESLVGTIVFGALFYVLGTFGFSKKDLK